MTSAKACTAPPAQMNDEPQKCEKNRNEDRRTPEGRDAAAESIERKDADQAATRTRSVPVRSQPGEDALRRQHVRDRIDSADPSSLGRVKAGEAENDGLIDCCENAHNAGQRGAVQESSENRTNR